MTLISKEWSIRIAVALAALVVGFAALSLGSSGPEDAPVALAFDDLLIEHLDESPVDLPLSVRVSGENLVGDVRLSIDAGYGPRSFFATAVDNTAEFIISPWRNPGSGLAILEARSGGRRGSSTVNLVPGEATSPLPVYLGPRTIEVGSGEIAMAVAVPVDARGNPTATGTDVSALVTRPLGQQETYETTTEHLLGFFEVPTRTTTGRTTISVNVGETSGPARIFDEVASVAATFELELLDPVPLADGQTLFRVRSSQLFDLFGNLLPDGTAGALDLRGVTNTRRIHGQTIDGRLHFVVEAPSIPGLASAFAHASGATSTELVLDFGSAVAVAPIEVIREASVVRVLVGPVLGPDGAFVKDGTEVAATVDGRTFLTVLEEGEAALTFSELTTLEVEILGTSIIPAVPQ